MVFIEVRLQVMHRAVHDDKKGQDRGGGKEGYGNDRKMT